MCVSGFPDVPVFEVGTHIENNTVTATTTVIPDMSFTYSSIIAGFIVAGRMLNREPYFKIQIWRPGNDSLYYRVQPNITVNRDVVCRASTRRVVSNVLFCILYREFRVTVQPGDILGLELPQTNQTDNGVFFTSGGPKNYIFKQVLTSPIKLNDSNYTVRAQQPQIAFNLTLGMDCYS